MTKDKKAEAPVELGDPVQEVVDFLAEYFGTVEKEGRKVKGLERITALKKNMDAAAKAAAKSTN
ncbi:hypothetical protein [Pseudodesulfovibrio pelocollis]|uniref:hypothetical protein n=1 Tax=Pseudodesulfovibrio pelocollis TaxID=3051432 RepID=UPI00255B356B|nr:hypothetical protein [Pseudodesulfovibrio sp. SB368]